MPNYYEFEIELKDIKPRIWRCLLIRSTCTFADLNDAIQDSFGWTDSHLWEFTRPGRKGRPIARVSYQDGSNDTSAGVNAELEPLAGYFDTGNGRTACIYQYDFGDSWDHKVTLRQVLQDKDDFTRRLLEGSRSGPPEDCGGTQGYRRMVHFLKTGDDIYDDYGVDLAAWLGDWKPDAFDLKKTKEWFDG